ncbi:MAG: hypothetical protein HY682_12500 [Chloroflexi bacterium]|nr:hypothetical protein [Chloroflexota bacterium]
MLALFGLAHVLGAMVYYLLATDIRGLYVVVVAYIITGLLLQRREGQLSRKDGEYYYRYSSGYTRKRIPDPTVRWDWRVRVGVFWLPWLAAIRADDVLLLAFGVLRYAWQFVVLGHDAPRPPKWKSHRRIFRTLPARLPERAATESSAVSVQPVPINGFAGDDQTDQRNPTATDRT